MERNTVWGPIVAVVGGGVVAGLLMTALQVVADQNPATDNVVKRIPYHGILEFDGEPVTALGEDAVWLKFDITDGDADDSPVVYSQSSQVQVFGGNFTALLGPTGDGDVQLNDVIAAADALHVRMTILGDPGDPSDDVALNNSRRLALSPHAVWATRATDFAVAGNLDAETVRVNGGTYLDPGLKAITLNTPRLHTANGLLDFTTNHITLGGTLIVDPGFSNLPSRNGLIHVKGELATYADPDTHVQEAVLHAGLPTDDVSIGRFGSATAGFTIDHGDADTLSVLSGAGSDLEMFGGGMDFKLGGTSYLRLEQRFANNGTLLARDITVNGTLSANSVSASSLSVNALSVPSAATSTSTSTFTSNLTVAGRLKLNDVTTTSNDESGCMRLAAMQICWGIIPNNGSANRSVTFQKAFGDQDFAVTLSANPGANREDDGDDTGDNSSRFMTITSRSTTGFGIRAHQADGDGSNSAGHYIAIGQPGTW